ncbi:Uncharacterised ACR, COG2135 [Legionella donaldsonii]|uniref:Abasic site processing protein n=1 Tax=Legionella donaldsonii TaxID=45060 RepID=A0A378KK50_9GAMM|nr:SOS response-associated peptidase [Legionella donaldsonii]STX84919.1 Uncharacterised ACR, COG2135 [Legionella donaldsonii]
MCGRFAIDADIEKIREQFKINSIDPLLKSYNVAPTEGAVCLIHTEEGLNAVQMRWGIVPWYTKGKKPSLLINARLETVAEKPAFQQSLKHRRCLMLMSGFFEWKHASQDKKTFKQPYYITRHDTKLMAVAAIWDNFKPEPDISIPSCCVLTTNENKTVSSLHERMPWILSESQQREWLESKSFLANDLEAIIEKNEDIPLDCYPVTPLMNSPYYKEKDSIQPLRRKLA